MTYYAQFNNFFLNSSGYRIDKIDVGTPKTNINKYELVRADGQIVTSQNYNQRTIKITGNINVNSLDNMYIKLDTLKANLVGIDKNLDVFFDSSKRRYIATVENFSYKTEGYYCTWEIIFTADALGKELDSTGLTFGTYIASGTTYTNNILGSYKSTPILRLTVSKAVPFWTSAYLEIKNAVTNQRMRITKTWGWSDIVDINGETKSVSIYPTATTLIDNCDSITGWTVGDVSSTLSLDTTNQLEGTGSFSTTCTVIGVGTGSTVNKLNFTPTLDMSINAGDIIFPIYIPSLTNIGNSSVRVHIGSNATLGTNWVAWYVSNQHDGSPFVVGWNYIKINLATTPSATAGTAVRTAIKSIRITLTGVSATITFATPWRLDYLSIQKASIVSEALDYEGTFPDLNLASCSITLTDELTSRSIAVTGTYYKRYL